MRIGYARTSTVEAKTGQKIDSQLDLLRDEGCDRIFADEGKSGTVDERPELGNAVSHARAGDEFIFRDFSRVSRTKYGPFRFIEDLDSRGVYWRSIRDGVDSNSPHHLIVVAIKSMENSEFIHVLRQRTREGLAAAKARGVHVGRPRALTDAQVKLVRAGRKNGSTVRELSEAFSVSKSVIYRALGDT